jgi:alpha-galactosidase
MKLFVRSSSVFSLAALIAGCGGNSPSRPAPVDAAPDVAPLDIDDDLPAALVPGAAPTPPMGWNSWNTFKQNITDGLFRQIADVMVASGMQDAGYRYINIDDTWSTKDAAPGFVRGADEPLLPDVRKFPNGMADLANYVHDQGLKLGIYADRGTVTCGSFPGSAGHEQQDATTFAGWGIDYVKYDNCPPTDDTSCNAVQAAYTTMGAALADSGRSMVYSLCAWNFCEWGLPIGSLWRTTKDITPDRPSFLGNLATNNGLAAFAGPSGWNDPDMLEVGNFALPEEETDTILADYRAHFTLWSIAAAPLITGNDLRHMSEAVRQILTNKEVIALDQDALGYQGVPVWIEGDLTMKSIWAKPLNESGARGVVLFNGTDAPADLSFDLTQIGLRSGMATARDLWAHADLPAFEDTFTTTVPAHDVVALRVLGVEPPKPPSGTVFLSDLPWIYAANRLGPVDRDQSNSASGAAPLNLRGTTYAKGLGLAAPSSVVFRLAKACTSFSATVGIDDKAKGNGSAVFQVWADGTKLFDSADTTAVVTGTSDPIPVQVDITGKHRLKLSVSNAGDGVSFDYADFADAKLQCD